MARYQKYAEYKDSGVEWLKEIPNDWQLTKAKYLFQKVQRVPEPTAGIVTAFRDGVVTLRSNRRTEGFTNSIYEIGYQGVQVNDLLIHSMDGFAGAIGVSDSDGKCSPVCSVCIAWNEDGIDVHYYGYLTRQLAVTGYITSLAKGIRERSTEFRFREFADLYLPVPSKSEQEQITKFIHHETAQIDSLIAKQEKLIELLKEKRQAVISHAVTKGLNPDVALKDSGEEWLGQVPKHWKVAPIKRIIHLMEQGKSPECENIPATSEQWGVLKTSCVNNGIFHSQQNKALPEHTKPHTQYQVKAGDVLMSRASGSINLIGSVALVPNDVQENLLLSDKIFRIHLTKDCDARFFTLLMATPYMRTLIERAISGAEGMANNITKTSILEFVSAIPPLKEQMELVNYLTQKIQAFDALVLKATTAIEVMQERRTALISSAVTGKIDVRNWQHPNEAETGLSA